MQRQMQRACRRTAGHAQCQSMSKAEKSALIHVSRLFQANAQGMACRRSTTLAGRNCTLRTNRNHAVRYSKKDDAMLNVEELFASKFGASIVDDALKGNPAFSELVQKLQQASPAEQAQFRDYAQSVLSSINISDPVVNQYKNNAQSEVDMSIGGSMEDKLELMRNSLQTLHQSLNGQPAYGKRIALENISSTFTASELSLMQRLTGINWTTFEVNQPEWQNVSDMVEKITLADVNNLAEITLKLQVVNQKQGVQPQEPDNVYRKSSAVEQQSTATESPSPSSVHIDSTLPVIEPVVIPAQHTRSAVRASSSFASTQGNDNPVQPSAPTYDGSSRNDVGAGFSSFRSTTEQGQRNPVASTSGQKPIVGDELFQQLVEMLDIPAENMQDEYNRYLKYKAAAKSGSLYNHRMSRHMKIILQVFKEMVIMANVQQGLRTNYSEQELDFKSTMMATTLADLFAAVQDGKVSDIPSLCVIKYMNSQLLQQSEDGALYMWGDGEEAADVVVRLGAFISAARNVAVMRDFLAAYTVAVTDDDMALKGQRLFEAWSDETWWVKDMRELNEEEERRWHELQLVSPDEVAIELLAGLDSDLLLFVTERLSNPEDEVIAKWIHHPEVGPKILDGSVLSTGVPEVWNVLYYIASRDSSGEFDTMADMTIKQQEQ